MPRTRLIRATPALSAGCTSSPICPPLRLGVFGWLLCVWPSFGGRLRPRHIFSFINFFDEFDGQNDDMAPPHMLHPGRVSSSTFPLPLTLTIGWLLCPPKRWRPSKPKSLSLSLFFIFCSLNSTPQRIKNIPPLGYSPAGHPPTS
jgi:hypothetical protein